MCVVGCLFVCANFRIGSNTDRNVCWGEGVANCRIGSNTSRSVGGGGG